MIIDEKECALEDAERRAKEKYYRLVRLAELRDEELCESERVNAENAMERVLRRGSIRDRVCALGLYVEYLHDKILLEEHGA